MDVADPLEKRELATRRRKLLCRHQKDNKALVRRFNEEVYNRGNLDVVDELLAPTFVGHDFRAGRKSA
jgi:hypothetical protein